MKLGELPLYLLIILVSLWWVLPDHKDEIRTPRQAEKYPAPTAPRTPAPKYYVDDPVVRENAMGTAFAIGDNGLWITARHAAGGCLAWDLAAPGGLGRRKVTAAWVHPNSDMALMQGPRPQSVFRLAANPPATGTNAFHIGFPHGHPGDVWSKVMGQARMVTTGRYRSEEPVTAYAEVERHPAFTGGLGGLSGGPIFNAAGEIIGVHVAGNPRRGRIIGTSPRSFARLYQEAKHYPTARTVTAPSITPQTLQATGNRLRARFLVAKLYCYVSWPAPPRGP